MMYLVFAVAIFIVGLGLWIDFGPKHKWPTGDVVIYPFHKPWYMPFMNTATWWDLNMNNCYGMQPHNWNQRYKSKGEKKIRYHDIGICTKCGKRWGFGSH